MMAGGPIGTFPGLGMRCALHICCGSWPVNGIRLIRGFEQKQISPSQPWPGRAKQLFSIFSKKRVDNHPVSRHHTIGKPSSGGNQWTRPSGIPGPPPFSAAVSPAGRSATSGKRSPCCRATSATNWPRPSVNTRTGTIPGEPNARMQPPGYWNSSRSLASCTFRPGAPPSPAGGHPSSIPGLLIPGRRSPANCPICNPFPSGVPMRMMTGPSGGNWLTAITTSGVRVPLVPPSTGLSPMPADAAWAACWWKRDHGSCRPVTTGSAGTPGKGNNISIWWCRTPVS